MPTIPEFKKAVRHLARRDDVLKDLIKRVGPCTLEINPDGFSVLARSIISQQISTKAAQAIQGRLIAALGGSALRPRAILQTSLETLREVGLSANKAQALQDLSEKCVSGAVPLKKLPTMPDEEVIETLLPVRGIGRWTAEMFLMFRLHRPDVLPVGDLGIVTAVQKAYGLRKRPTPERLRKLGDAWKPYRSIACWYLWRSLDNGDGQAAAVP